MEVNVVLKSLLNNISKSFHLNSFKNQLLFGMLLIISILSITFYLSILQFNKSKTLYGIRLEQNIIFKNVVSNVLIELIMTEGELKNLLRKAGTKYDEEKIYELGSESLTKLNKISESVLTIIKQNKLSKQQDKDLYEILDFVSDYKSDATIAIRNGFCQP